MCVVGCLTSVYFDHVPVLNKYRLFSHTLTNAHTNTHTQGPLAQGYYKDIWNTISLRERDSQKLNRTVKLKIIITGSEHYLFVVLIVSTRFNERERERKNVVSSFCCCYFCYIYIFKFIGDFLSKMLLHFFYFTLLYFCILISFLPANKTTLFFKRKQTNRK